jgi:fatty-acyl-CoA synthase
MEATQRIAPGGPAHWMADSGSIPMMQSSIGDALRAAARQWPDATALVEGHAHRDKRRRWSFAALLRDAERAAHALLWRFLPGEHVAIWAPNGPEWVVLELGAALAGVTLVTVNPAYLGAELAFVLRQSRAAGIVVAPRHRGRSLLEVFDQVRGELPLVREVICLDAWDAFLDEATDVADLPEVRPDAIAQIQYTSGTTGFPKGAMLTHCGLANNGRLYAAVIGARAGDVWINPMPMFHTAGCGLVTLGALQTGGTHVLPPAFDPAVVLELFASERGTLTLCVPTMLVRLLEAAEGGGFDLSSWRLVTLGGAPVPPELVRRAERRLGATVAIGFGQTEASPYITHTVPGDPRPDWVGTVGRPMPGIEVKICDPESGLTLKVGAVGEICTRSACVMEGYFDNPAATSQAVDAAGWLRTGDLGSMEADGYVRIQAG